MNFVLFPVILMISALSEPLFQILLPEKWSGSVPFVQLLCMAAVMFPMHSVNLNILKVMGRSDIFLYLEIVKIFLAAGILIFSINFGVYGVLIGQIISSFIAYIPNSYYSGKIIDYPVREQLLDFMPCLLLASVISLLAYFAVNQLGMTPLMKLLVIGFAGFSMYLLMANALKLEGFRLVSTLAKERLVKS